MAAPHPQGIDRRAAGAPPHRHQQAAEAIRHDHAALGLQDSSERRTRQVVALTVVTMVAELVVGYRSGSMALTADGWHMGTHAAALGMAAGAYWFARTRAPSAEFPFGTGKVYALSGYTSALLLGAVALGLMWESVALLWHPSPIRFTAALPVAVVGLGVNLVSAWLLRPLPTPAGAQAATSHEVLLGHAHDHHHHDPLHGHHQGPDPRAADGAGPDHNLAAAYLHVVADALTSVLAIGALVAGRWLGWAWLDPAVGLLGGAVILKWAIGLAATASRQLLDAVPSTDLAERIRRRLESIDDARVVDLHLWQLGPGRTGCVVSLVTGSPRATGEYRDAIRSEADIACLTVEVHRCPAHTDGGEMREMVC